MLKLIQVSRPLMVFNLLMLSQKMETGVLQHNLTQCSEEGQVKEMLKWIKWNLRDEAKLLPPLDECSSP